jgi:hypothetical protein
MRSPSDRLANVIFCLQSTAILPRLSMGRHQLLFRNSHHQDRNVYLANALVPSPFNAETQGTQGFRDL